MKSRKKVIALICTLSVAYIGLFYCYIKNYKLDDDNDKKITNVISTVTVDKAINFIKEYKIDYLDNINMSFTSKDITNQNKLRYVYYAIKDDVDFTSGVSYTKVVDYLENVFGEGITIKKENVINNQKEILLLYDKVNEVFKYDDEPATYNFFASSYNNVVDFEIKYDNYILTVNKFFVVDNEVYGSIDDAKTESNILFTIDDQDVDQTAYIKDYLATNYNKIKNKLYLYKYHFTKENGELILVKYDKISKS